MYDLRNFSGRKHLRAVGVVLLGALCAFQVAAGPFTSTQSGNSVTYSSNNYAADAAVAGASLVVSAGVVYASQPSTVRTLAGAVAPLVVRAAPVAGAIGGAVATCLANPLCLVATAAAAALVANEIGYKFDNTTGTPVVTKKDSAVCSAAPCYDYQIDYNGGTIHGSTPMIACQAWADYHNAHLFTGTSVYSATTSYCTVSRNGNVQPYSWNRVASVSPSAPVYKPSTVTEFATAIGAKTDWANDSKLPALVDKIVKTVPQSIGLQVPSVTGPTSIAGVPTVVTKADGSKVTTTRGTNFGYVGPRVDMTETTIEQATNIGGTTTTTSTTTSAATPDSACATNSNGAGCQADEFDVPSDEIPKTNKTITFAAENLGFSGGSCPSDVTKVIAGKTVKLVDWVSNCNYLTTYAKPMILAAATFAALMIIFMGGKLE